jgi:hypothetical protein
MARKFIYYADGAAEMWDDEAETYSKFDSEGYEVARRALTDTEKDALDPNALKLRKVAQVTEQLILNQLMTGKPFPRLPMAQALNVLYQRGRLDLEGLNKAVTLGWINEQHKQAILSGSA